MELTWIIKKGLYVCLQVGFRLECVAWLPTSVYSWLEVGLIQVLSEIGMALLFSSITRSVFFGL